MIGTYQHINRLYNNNNILFKKPFSFFYLSVLIISSLNAQIDTLKNEIVLKDSLGKDTNQVKEVVLKWDEVLASKGAVWKKYYYENKQLSSEGFELKGKPEGKWTTYYAEGGKSSEGFRKDHKLDGKWYFYRKDGSLKNIITYENDLKNGFETHFNTEETKVSQFYFKNGQKDSVSKFFYLNGALKELRFYTQNKLEGYSLNFDSIGQYIVQWNLFKNNVAKFSLKINRKDARGNKTGKWVYFFPVKDSSFQKIKIFREIEFKNDLYHGIFKEYDAYGKIIVFKRYVMGEEVLEDELTGVAVTDREYHENGNLSAVGAYKNGKKNGIWSYFKDDGSPDNSILYNFDTIVGEGQITKSGQKNGYWKLYYEDGSLKSEGMYEAGDRVGEWKFYFPSGKINQKGFYNKGLKSGTWIWYFENGNIRLEEEYINDLQDGTFVEYDSLENIIAKGEFIEGYRSGDWEITVAGHLYKGKFADDHRNGEWIGYWHGKDLYFKGSFAAGKPEGKHFYYHENGNLAKKEQFVGGYKNGKFIEFNENKEIVNILKYKNGVLIKINGIKVKDFDVEQPIEIRDPFETYE